MYVAENIGLDLHWHVDEFLADRLLMCRAWQRPGNFVYYRSS